MATDNGRSARAGRFRFINQPGPQSDCPIGVVPKEEERSGNRVLEAQVDMAENSILMSLEPKVLSPLVAYALHVCAGQHPHTVYLSMPDATSWAHSIKCFADGPTVRPLSVTIPTGRRIGGKLTGSTFNAKCALS